jgi:hypothetical protein
MEKILLALLIHFVADFVLQTRAMGKGKSESISWLLIHLAIQYGAFFYFFGHAFAIANALIHGMIDWNIWKLYKLTVKLRNPRMTIYEAQDYRYWDDHLFYTTIGLDQMLHGATLIILLEVLR